MSYKCRKCGCLLFSKECVNIIRVHTVSDDTIIAQDCMLLDRDFVYIEEDTIPKCISEQIEQVSNDTQYIFSTTFKG